MKRVFTVIIAVAVVLGFSLQAHTELELRGEGTSAYGTFRLIYDTDLDITWYDYSDLWGTWAEQMAWANALSVTFSGKVYGDWRLPTTTQPDPSCDEQYDPGEGFPLQGYGYNCTGGELGHLYYTGLGNQAGGPLTYTGDFQNLSTGYYWTGTEVSYSETDQNAWRFHTNGYQSGSIKAFSWYAIAVHDGDIAIRPILKGDVNGDSQVDLTDAILCLQILSGLVPGDINPASDVDGDGKIGMAEAVYAIQKATAL